MSSSTRDKLYLPVVATQLVGMLTLDLVPFYPSLLWQSPSAPLHPIVSLRKWWTTHSGDPYFASSTREPWFEAFLYVELLIQLPLTLYLAYKLGSMKPTSGPTELAGLVYACLTFMGSTACAYDIWYMGADKLRAEHKPQLFWGTYLPFAVIPALMAVDMYLRLLARVYDHPKRP
ncbi:uncharacterized protein MAM_02658 [Metarhizium album ARSEF 1941]|uniref:EXPERA domain-containing protein n=1 Tax=Metarhizium album (strain ARSEF 1941) TaxID=1081103 RepID=A0A0B2X3D2_METAS|nr:uncharacterized protein MAM_02658 [Metarhizium album ARSEF 1941]KHN99805.1 hypothetical protein MAM_02658 [Metarhizium album ARSEF 1941]